MEWSGVEWSWSGVGWSGVGCEALSALLPLSLGLVHGRLVGSWREQAVVSVSVSVCRCAPAWVWRDFACLLRVHVFVTWHDVAYVYIALHLVVL